MEERSNRWPTKKGMSKVKFIIIIKIREVDNCMSFRLSCPSKRPSSSCLLCTPHFCIRLSFKRKHCMILRPLLILKSIILSSNETPSFFTFGSLLWSFNGIIWRFSYSFASLYLPSKSSSIYSWGEKKISRKTISPSLGLLQPGVTF